MGRKTDNRKIDRIELESLAFDITYVIEQCFSFFNWEYCIMPGIQSVQPDNFTQNSIQLIKNATIEATLMFMRKLNAFFTSKKQNRESDDVYAFDFPGFTKIGWFLSKEQVDELNLRVGHVTLIEARMGKKQWPIADWVNAAMEKSIPFIDYLLEDFFEEGSEKWLIINRRKLNIIRHIDILNSIAKQTTRDGKDTHQGNSNPAP